MAEEELPLEGISLAPAVLIDCCVTVMFEEREIDNFPFHNTSQPVNMK